MTWNMDKEKWIGAALLGVMFFWVASIDDKPHAPTGSNSVVPSTADLTRIDNNVTGLKYRLDFLETSVQGLRNFNAESALLDMDSKTYSSVDTSIGKLLVSVDEVIPTLNGFNIKLNIGNPNFMTLNDVDTTIYYGEPTKIIHTKILTRLMPGRWNHAEITIAPATKEQIKKVGVSFEPSNVQLGL